MILYIFRIIWNNLIGKKKFDCSNLHVSGLLNFVISCWILFIIYLSELVNVVYRQVSEYMSEWVNVVYRQVSEHMSEWVNVV
jgi:hypothetical protein